MCRWIAYTGQPIFIEQIVALPKHSLVNQSMDAQMNFDEKGSLLSINADGSGIGWYGRKKEPGIFKDELPAWSNENLHEICRQVRAHTFFAHVRARTTGAIQRSNCHPFKHKNWLFQHNGHIGQFEVFRQDLHEDIRPDLYHELTGTTDSETFFLLALTFGLEKDPKEALRRTVLHIREVAKDHKTKGDMSLSCTLTDGKTLYTLRYAEEAVLLSQFYSNKPSWSDTKQEDFEGTVFVSEPLDQRDESWIVVPENTFTTTVGSDVQIEEFMSSK